MERINEFDLIEAVRLRPQLWDIKSPQFRNKHLKTEAWESVAKQLGNTADACIYIWKKLRERYTRTKRLHPPGSEGSRRKWDKQDAMKFLEKVLCKRRTFQPSEVNVIPEPQTSGVEHSVFSMKKKEVISEDSVIHQPPIEEIECDPPLRDPMPSSGVEPLGVSVTKVKVISGDIVINQPAIEKVECDPMTYSGVGPLVGSVIKEEIFLEDTVISQPSKEKVECDTPVGEFMPCSGEDRSLISEDSTSATTPTTTTSQTRLNVKRKRVDFDKIRISLINTINKLGDASHNAEDLVTNSFIKYYEEQIKQLLKLKSSAQQRQIQNRLITFVDKLFDEFG